MSVLEKRAFYKPFQYEFAVQAFDLQQKMHWLPGEVPLHEDVKDWRFKLSDQERDLLTQLFRFFTQADMDIAGGYIDKYLPVFKNPDIRHMLGAFINMEFIHQQAYSLLLDTVGMPEIEYRRFQEYEDMKSKHDYLETVKTDTLEDVARALAIYSGFGEGLQLFSSFAILLNFPRFNKMKGMGQIVSFSIKDETLHVESLIKLFHVLLDENPKLWRPTLKKEIYQAAEDMVDLEDKFIDLCFSSGKIEGLEVPEVKKYIRFIADRRLLQLGLKPKFKQKYNPLPWLDWITAVEHTNFFENSATSYAKSTIIGNWEEAYG